MKAWYQSPVESILAELSVKQASGLSTTEVRERLKHYGLNQLSTTKKINPLKLFLGQFKDVLIIILIVAAAVSLALGIIEGGDEGIQEASLIFAIVIAIALVGFFNEYKAERTVEALKKLVGFRAHVRRDSKTIEVDATELVPGDIVILEAGQKLPADIRLIEANELQVNEASLTGESMAVGKNTAVITKTASLGDQKNMLFSGTHVTNGSGLGIVVGTGGSTELGKIAELVQGVEEEATPMQQKLDALGKKLGYIIASICAIVFLVIFLLVPEARETTMLHRLIFAFTAAVALAVAAIPEGLAFVVRISLALGARRMAQRNALVRKLSAVEALGSTDVICSDKTGTLTKGEMTVRHLYTADQLGNVSGSGYSTEGSITFKGTPPSSLQRLLEVGVLCNNSILQKDRVIGDPTEGCLIVSAAKADINRDSLEKQWPRIHEVPFSSERKMMTTIHKNTEGQYLVANKGALEVTLQHCRSYIGADGTPQELTKDVQERLLAINKELAGQALRVLAFAYKTAATDPAGKNVEEDLTFVGLQAMMDPPRQEVIEVVGRVQSEAGVRVIMITGDYIDTARAVAKEIGITGDAVSGVELEDMSDEQLMERAEAINVYARVNPEHKIRIVQALKHHGHQVAMTGDGVNDAPAIKAADIGIAMGITGTDVTKEASDLILLDDQFLTIVSAIEEGRGIFDNMRKFVNFLISCNIAEVITILLGILLFNDLLLTAAQLLFINIVTDGLPAVALGSDPAQKNILKHKPRRFQEKILSTRVWTEIFIFGSLMSAALVVQFWYNHTHETRIAAVSAAFTAMVVYEIVRLIDIRTDYHIRWFANPWLTVAMASSLLLQISVLYVPFMAKYFDVQPLSGHDWIFMGVGSVLLFAIMKLANPILDRLVTGSEPA